MNTPEVILAAGMIVTFAIVLYEANQTRKHENLFADRIAQEMHRRIEKDEEIHGRLESFKQDLEFRIESERQERGIAIGTALQEFASNFDVRGAKGDYLELRQQVQLLREKVYGENSTFCQHGITPRLCKECNPVFFITGLDVPDAYK